MTHRTTRSIDFNALNISHGTSSTSYSVGGPSSMQTKRSSIQQFSPTLPPFSTQASEEFFRVQEKTFRKWLNAKLESAGKKPMFSLETDLSDGVNLIQLIEIMSGQLLGRYNTRPIMRVQKAENCTLALTFIRSRGIILTNIGPEDIVDGNLKLILGMIWTLILRFTIADISEEGKTAKDGLLLWAQRQTHNYHEVDVRDFSKSWKDGLAFCALLHKNRPDLLDYNALDKNDAYANTQLAFRVAEQALGIPQLLEVADIVSVSKPDDKVVMTYVAELFLAFSDANKTQSAARRIANFAEATHSIYITRNEYERRAADLLAKVDDTLSSWRAELATESYDVAIDEKARFMQHKIVRREWTREKAGIESLFGNIVTKLKTYGMKPYTAPKGFSLVDIDLLWHEMLESEAQRSRMINNRLRLIKDRLRKQFADLANSLAHELANIASGLTELDGPFEHQLQAIAHFASDLSKVAQDLPQLKELEQSCLAAKIDENDFTIYDYADISFEARLVTEALQKRRAFINNQSIARQETKLSPSQLEEFESVFRHFDESGDNTLNLQEFAAALPALGLNYNEREIEDTHARLADEDGLVKFEAYLKFLVDITQDTFSPSQIREAFASLASARGYLIDRDLQIAEISGDMQSFLSREMRIPVNGGSEPVAEQSLDYERYLQRIFG